MDSLSLDAARALLMGENIRPLTADEKAGISRGVDEISGLNEIVEPSQPEGTSEVETQIYASLHEAEEAAFEATLDAAFGKLGASDDANEFDGELDDDDSDETLSQDRGVEPQATSSATSHIQITSEAPAGTLHAGVQASSFDNGMVGLGVDIVEIERMQRILVRNPSFASKVFSVEEQIYCDTQSNTAAHYAVRFAAKEAVVKALGTGFSEGIGVRDIEVERSKNGRPLVKLSGAAARIAKEQGILEISLSMSYTKTDAVACAMAVTQSAVRATEKRKDPMKELAQQFKETRKILDDL